MSLESLPLLRLKFALTSLDTLAAPPYKGDLLRMALLWWLSEFWCPEADRCRHGCRHPNVCLFGQLCEPAVNSTWSSATRRLIGDSPPPAYTLWDMRDRRTHIVAGSPWTFELTWVGNLAVHQIPSIVAAIQRGAEQGMGHIRWRNQVRRVSAWMPGDLEPRILADTEPYHGAETLIWKANQVENVAFGYAQAAKWAEQWTTPLRTLRIDYLSPVKLKERGEWVETPEFSAIARALTRRLRILSEVYGDGEWPHAEYGPLLDLADDVRLDHHETHWLDYARHSKQSGAYQVEGFVGPAWYTAEDFRPLLPVLWLGQWLHIGKSYVIGSGRYQLQIDV
jgi:hypothetical protein